MMTTVLLLLVAVLIAPTPSLPGGWVRQSLAGNRWPGIPHMRRRDALGDSAINWVLALAGELRAGSDPMRAVQVCTQRHGVAQEAARTARLGGDVAAALRADAESTGATVLRAVAGSWQLAQTTGAGLASVLENTADGYRRTLAVRRTLDVELASPRATARMMSLLPLIGVGLGILLGAQPLVWLTTTMAGILTLIAGAGLNLAGFLWIRQIVRNLESST